ncbi:methyl-accepting chemotaxis protein [Vreelandella malpeensis]|uniref:HAMP domain-containing protein n=1 Tax=Vreelandella malpeensis TaxID=1172368 RepID=A0ABS8DQZ9_9GAMM|nr:methyl-accepting chemotaxis protein [Halomonas malpeensis]MCB8888714.1 HAMP domain-containing protein [Halomonas malpeensis]
MKKSLSIRTMLITLFAAAVLGAGVLAATGWLTNQRLVDAQRYITGDVLPLQEASRHLVLTMGAFGQRHADLLAAQSDAALEAVTPQAALDERFQRGRADLARLETGGQSEQLATLDHDYAQLLAGDAALETVRRDTLRFRGSIAARIQEMEERIASVIQSAQTISDRTMYSQARRFADQRDLMEAWREEGTTTLPTQLLDNLYAPQVDIGRLSGEARLAISRLADLSRQMVQAEDMDALMDLRNYVIAPQVSLALQSLAAIAEAPSTEVEQRAMINALAEEIEALNELMVEAPESVFALREAQLALAARTQAALQETAGALEAMSVDLDAVNTHIAAQANTASAQAEGLADTGRTLLVLVALGVVMVLAVFGWRTLVRVLGPLVLMRRQMESIGGASGESADLSKRLALARNDEVGQAALAFNQMMDTFEAMVRQVRESAEDIAHSSRQIADGNENLSQRTDQQAASLAQTASSIEQMAATVKQTADYADQAKDASHHVDQRARSAGEVARQSAEAMGAIRQASEKITSIIKAIDDIAFQTNLLALNASVEAARAGEQGRGFAVVAQEVRKLAGRSADEAAQIRHLVDDSVRKVSEGEHLVTASSEHLQEIVDSLNQVTQYVTDIASATFEQSSGIDQINEAIAQLDQVTHQNAKLVQEANQASQTLDERASDMHGLMSRFQVSAGQRPVALPAGEELARLT